MKLTTPRSNTMHILRELLLVLLFTTPALSQVITGKVVNVSDGDTITIRDSSGLQRKIRLYGIDTQEKTQAYGKAARSFTASLTAGKTVVNVTSYDTDRYGRTVGVVKVNGTNVNQSILEDGYAWAVVLQEVVL